MHKRVPLIVLTFLSLITCVLAGTASAETAVPTSTIVPGTIRTDAAFEHIGVVWEVSGDTDLDSSLLLEFREQGTVTWQQGALAMRAYPTINVNGSPLGLDYWAASALFLDAGKTYELRLTLTDPDGGGQMQTVTATTRTWPQPATVGRQLYVSPGSGGGNGSLGNPFLGLQAAADAAQPGDTFHIASGSYGEFQLLTSGTASQPITFMGPGDGTAVIDGHNTDRGVVTLGEYNQTLGYVILQGLTIQNGAWGIDAQHTHNIYIHHNIIQDVDFGIYNRRADGLEANQTICDNTITGRTVWPGSGIPSERGIDLRGTGNVVCYNQVQNFGDCVSVQPFTSSSYGNDIFGNDAAYCVDDGIEIDYNQANVRVWRNRVMNARMGVSVQPIRGGPAYIFRNEFFNLESVPIKMHNETTGFIVAHNSGAKHGDGHGDNGAMWRNAVFRNNLFLGTRYAFEFTTVADEGFRDFNYNAWGTSRAIGTPSDPYFKWDNVRYDFITDLPAGVEDNGVAVDFSDVVNATLPADWNVAAVPGSRDLRLTSGSPAINGGTPLANLNDAFALSGAPDMGAFEFGQPLPAYGPRALTPDLSSSSKVSNNSTPAVGEVVTYTITLQNSGAPLTETVLLTDTLPAELLYQPGSLTADFGTPDDTNAPMLTWSGTPGTQANITITYAATVVEPTAQLVTNTAVIDDGLGSQWSVSAQIIVNGQTIHLPLVARE